MMEFKNKIYSKLFKKIALMLIFTTTFATGFLLNKKSPNLKDAFNRSAISQKSTNRVEYTKLAKKPLITPTIVKAETTVQHCAKNSNINELKSKTPQIAQDFNILSQLTLTGQSVYKYLKNPRNNITSCTESFAKLKLAGVYFQSYHKLKVANISSTKTYFHEAFHVHQNTSFKSPKIYRNLNKREAVFAVLIQEATAVAYEMIAEQEAKNKNIKLISTRSIDFRILSASDDYNLRKLFYHNYNNYIDGDIAQDTIVAEPKEKNNDYRIIKFGDNHIVYVKDNVYSDTIPVSNYIPNKTTSNNNSESSLESRALQYAGRAVVEHLVSAKNKNWAEYYTVEAMHNTRLYYSGFRTVKNYTESSNHIKKRAAIYEHLSHVSSSISLIPKKYLGNNATTEINISLLKFDKYLPLNISSNKNKKMKLKLG